MEISDLIIDRDEESKENPSFSDQIKEISSFFKLGE